MDINSDKLNFCGDYFSKKNLKLILAESMTAGFISSVISLEINSGDYFLGSIVCYHDDMKISSLGVDPELIKKAGAVSEEVTHALLNGLRDRYDAHIAVAVTGYAFEDKAISDENPVGTVFLQIQYQNSFINKKCLFTGEAHDIITATANEIIENLYEMVLLSETQERDKI
ncbi:CinA family protein [Sphingobacterium spiritivorum]|uniref:Competence/damage-inducible domain protein CinA n=1 Tax=Sphingobacterium spiritivorum ATCC 33861 TaxID=525373 RepID=D7VIE0_SPHSI|nr:nicotinamide-nucleotide amidohydrolase family protein [Sphingobacterium spiritivorum]EFK59842.1 competence/damage-inducible domain protein CinA [Sphingobacterium spiritivorum ATCC 33861]QQT37519.1 CinA family protein [Sphingobacterium spiritivorum]WQD34314.1 nicotinamide-nucleotide amidohydrolase family protein [Sphingobacterium spiritivorum]SUI97138.1 competence damage-inducible protein A [Sphingobacterium spiritivorum]